MSHDHIEAEFVEEKGTALAVPVPSQQLAPSGLFGTDDPDVFIDKAAKVATSLKKIIDAKGLSKNLGRGSDEYIEIGGWQLLGGMLKVYSSVEWTKPIEGGFEARVVVHDTQGNKLGAAEAQCTRDERNWKTRDDYALRSMAQTRAEGKAYRSVLGFIVELAGYKSTPAAEMPPVDPDIADTAPSYPDLLQLATDKGVNLPDFIVDNNIRPDFKLEHKIKPSERILCAKKLAEL